MRRSRAIALALAFAAALVLALPGAGAAALPCGVVDPVDRILDCDDAAPGDGADGSDNDATSSGGGTEPAAEPAPRTFGLSAARIDPTRLLVRFTPGTALATARRVARKAGGELERRIAAIGIDVVKADPARLSDVAAALKRSPAVRDVDSERLVAATAVFPSDPYWGTQTGLRVARLPDAWSSSLGSPEVVVAVVDTGVSALHQDLAGAVLPGYDAVNGDADASDDNGHGTAVAGVIAARANNGLGIAGVCWLCRILPVKVLGANGFGSSSAVAAGIVWAADRGADVVNLSLGSPETTQALSAAVRYASQRGALVVAAAGNAGVATPFYPAAERGVLGVAATDDHDRPYSWSNRGGWVPLAAPGCLMTTALDGGYSIDCGTSFAAPIVAGVAGLALGLRPTLPASEVAAAARRAAAPIGSVVSSGRVDAMRTLALLPTPAPRVVSKSVVLRATLDARAPTREVVVDAAAGTITARLTRDDTRLALLDLFDRNGRALARSHGRPPRQIVLRVAAGRYRVRVGGAPGAFVLSVDYAAIEGPGTTRRP